MNYRGTGQMRLLIMVGLSITTTISITYSWSKQNGQGDVQATYSGNGTEFQRIDIFLNVRTEVVVNQSVMEQNPNVWTTSQTLQPQKTRRSRIQPNQAI